MLENKQMRNESLKPPKLLGGVTYVENIAAKQIEEIYDVKFLGEKPAKAVLDEANKESIQRMHKKVATMLGLPDFDPIGQYVPEVNTVFVKETDKFPPPDPLYSYLYETHNDLHENFHAYTVQRKPSIYFFIIRMHKMYSWDTTLEYMKQRAASYFAFREAIADWTATEARLRLYPIDLSKTPQFSHEGVASVIEKYAQENEKYSWTPITYRFVRESMKLLTNNGLSEAEALNALIKKPPTHYKHLIDPTSYSTSIIDKR